MQASSYVLIKDSDSCSGAAASDLTVAHLSPRYKINEGFS